MFTLDTGRLHDETLALLDRLERRYQRRIQVFYPDAKLIEQYVRDNGINGFYLGLEERQSCCSIRKIEPFKRAIAGHKAWVTGVRREQSAERALGESVAWDERYGLWKISPMLDWTEAGRVGLHQGSQPAVQRRCTTKAIPSIGCAPCTRAVEPGADPRSGRWWWENPDSRECGLQPRRRVIPLKVEPRRAAASSGLQRRAHPWTTSRSSCVSPASRCSSSAAAKSLRARSICCCAPAAKVTVVAPELVAPAGGASSGGRDRAPRRRVPARASGRHAARDRGDRQARDQCVGRAPGRAPQHSGQRRRRSRAVALHRAGDRRSFAGRRRSRQQRRCAGADASSAREARIVPAATARRARASSPASCVRRQGAHREMPARVARFWENFFDGTIAADVLAGREDAAIRVAEHASPTRSRRSQRRRRMRAKSCWSVPVPAIRAC